MRRFLRFWRARTSLSQQTEVISLKNAAVTVCLRCESEGCRTREASISTRSCMGPQIARWITSLLHTNITKSELCVQSHLIAQGCENTRPSSDWPLIFTHH